MAIADPNIVGHHQLIAAKVHQRINLRQFQKVVIIFQCARSAPVIHILGKNHAAVGNKVDVVTANDAIFVSVARPPAKARRRLGHQFHDHAPVKPDMLPAMIHPSPRFFPEIQHLGIHKGDADFLQNVHGSFV